MRAMKVNGLVYRHYGRLMRYRLEPFDGRVVLFMPTGDGVEGRDRTLKLWREALRREPEVVDVPGQHHTVFDEAAETVGRWLRDEIARWQH
jgi:thioesterase domain-containing protein